MLAIPLVTAGCGFIPACIMTVTVWFFMLCTGLLFLEASLWLPEGSHVLSIAEAFLGKGGRYLCGITFIFLYYCLMIAYFAAGGPLLGNGLATLGIEGGHHKHLALFGLIFGGVVVIGPRWIDRTNMILSLAMIMSWLALLGSGGSAVRSDYLLVQRWPAMFGALPILFSAFGFHNVIPSLCTYLQRDRKALRLAIWWGSLIPLLVYIAWQWLIIGGISSPLIEKALELGEPITAVFQAVTGDGVFVALGRFFAFFAIATSTLGVAFSLVDFLGDSLGVVRRTGWKRLVLSIAVFVPPFVLASANPRIFAKALGIAGGFGEAFLNGLLPVAVIWVGRYYQRRKTTGQWIESRPALALLFVCGLAVMLLEIYELFFS